MEVRYTQYTTTRTMQTGGTFRCESCSYAAPVMVRGIGQGVAVAGLLKNAERAQLEAHMQAEQDGCKDADAVLAVVPCPKCQRRNASARAFKRRGWLAGVGVLLLTAAITTGLVAMESSKISVAICILVGGLWSYWSVRKRRFTWSSAESRVKFFEPAACDRL